MLNVGGCSLQESCPELDYSVSCPNDDNMTLIIHKTTPADIGAWVCRFQGTGGSVATTNLHQFGEC